MLQRSISTTRICQIVSYGVYDPPPLLWIPFIWNPIYATEWFRSCSQFTQRGSPGKPESLGGLVRLPAIENAAPVHAWRLQLGPQACYPAAVVLSWYTTNLLGTWLQAPIDDSRHVDEVVGWRLSHHRQWGCDRHPSAESDCMWQSVHDCMIVSCQTEVETKCFSAQLQ